LFSAAISEHFSENRMIISLVAAKIRYPEICAVFWATLYIYNKYWGVQIIYLIGTGEWGVQIQGSRPTYYMLHRNICLPIWYYHQVYEGFSIWDWAHNQIQHHIHSGRPTPHYSDRLCSDRRYSDSPCTVGTSGGLLQLNRPTGSTDWKDAEPNPQNQGQYNNVLEVRCNFSRGGGITDPLGYPPQALLPSVISVPRSIPCFRCIQRLDPFQFLPNFYYFYICQAC